MAINTYRDFVVEARDAQKDANGLRGFTVRVLYPGQGQPIPRTIPETLEFQLQQLSNRTLAPEAIITLGVALANLILPADIPNDGRQFFEQIRAGLGAEQGLRLRLQLDPSLERIPWEYVYIQQASGEKDHTGFLALDPRISIVRQEALTLDNALDAPPHPRRLLVVLASPADPCYPPLQLAQEKAYIQNAVTGIPGLQTDFLEDPTIQKLGDALQSNVDIFHFAGHGNFAPTGLSATPGVLTGQGEIILVDDTKHPVPLPADQLAVNLHNRGTQLAVLGACRTAQRDDMNIWSGVVAALMEVGLPSAVAMQYKIADGTGIEFSRSFYHALTAGLPLDTAISAARLAIFNKWHAQRDDPDLARYWCDWGVPVLYLRIPYDQVFALPTILNPAVRQGAADQAVAVVNQRLKLVLGEVVGQDIEQLTAGINVVTTQEVDTVGLTGKVTGQHIHAMSGGQASVDQTADTVRGKLVGTIMGNFNRSPSTGLAHPTDVCSLATED